MLAPFYSPSFLQNNLGRRLFCLYGRMTLAIKPLQPVLREDPRPPACILRDSAHKKEKDPSQKDLFGVAQSLQDLSET
jgi:hypothetical protein